MSATTENIFRMPYRELSDEDKARMKAVKEKAAELFDVIQESTPDGRYKSLAKTAIEESIMWSVKGITE